MGDNGDGEVAGGGMSLNSFLLNDEILMNEQDGLRFGRMDFATESSVPRDCARTVTGWSSRFPRTWPGMLFSYLVAVVI